MKFSLLTLKDYLETSATTKEICESLTKIGLEVESCNDESQNLSFFTVAKIIETKAHENSTKLKICLVETCDSKTPLQIICGASNARAGIKVAYAPIGSVIPANGILIKKAKIAGTESNGMLCSARELGLGNEDSGIIEINDNFAIGTKISEVFSRNDVIIEINITPNRGDCLGVYGIARDLSASGIGTLKKLEIEKKPAKFPFDLKIKNESPENCNYACFRLIKNVKNCQSPNWLVEKLNKVGINSISAIVDITNYVMHILNRPMHAYDADKINSEIIIGQAKEEEFISLKNEKFILDEKILTISDDQKVLAVAGIIGSNNSSCEIETKNILLESAYFKSNAIAYSGRKLGILSDARQRFERGVDYKTCEQGIDLATKLILEICGGEASEIEFIGTKPEAKFINFEIEKIKQLTGVEVNKDKALQILNNLEFRSNKDSTIEIPSHRHDIFANEDLVEEVIRIYGYDKINKQSFTFSPSLSINSKSHLKSIHKARLTLAYSGMIENISWSFVDSKLIELFGEKNDNLTLANPISSEMDHLRNTLAIGLVCSYHKNTLRSFHNLSLFEIGNIFVEVTNSPNYQKTMIAGLRAGKNHEPNHFHEQRDFDIFDVKKDFFEVVETFGMKGENLQISTESLPKYYHPHRATCMKLGKNIVGYFGEIHPSINKFFDLKNRINFFEIFIDSLPISNKSNTRKAYLVNDLPIVERDFSFITDEDLPVGDLTSIIASSDKKLIKEVGIFDIFSGNKIEKGKKSVALRVKIQPLEKTLTSEEIEEVSKKIIEIAEKSCGAFLRTVE